MLASLEYFHKVGDMFDRCSKMYQRYGVIGGYRHLPFVFGDEKNIQDCLESYRKYLLDLVTERPVISALEIGCGTGGLACELLKNTNCNINGIASSVDEISESISLARKQNVDDRCEFQVMDMNSDIWIRKNSYDLIYAIDSCCYFLDFDRACKNISNSLTKSGRFIFSNLYLGNSIKSLSQEEDIKKLENGWLMQKIRDVADVEYHLEANFDSYRFIDLSSNINNYWDIFAPWFVKRELLLNIIFLARSYSEAEKLGNIKLIYQHRKSFYYTMKLLRSGNIKYILTIAEKK